MSQHFYLPSSLLPDLDLRPEDLHVPPTVVTPPPGLTGSNSQDAPQSTLPSPPPPPSPPFSPASPLFFPASSLFPSPPSSPSRELDLASQAGNSCGLQVVPTESFDIPSPHLSSVTQPAQACSPDTLQAVLPQSLSLPLGLLRVLSASSSSIVS